MEKREILIILNRLRDVAESDTDSKLTLNKTDAKVLLDYLLKLKKEYTKKKDLINNIVTVIEREM